MIGDKGRQPISGMYFITDKKVEKKVLEVECLCLAISTLDKTGEAVETGAVINELVGMLMKQLGVF